MKQKQKNPKAPKAVNYWLLVDGFTPAAQGQNGSWIQKGRTRLLVITLMFESCDSLSPSRLDPGRAHPP